MAKSFKALKRAVKVAPERTSTPLAPSEIGDNPEAPEAYGKRAIATLDAVAASLKAGMMYEDLEEEIDALLGTDMSPRNKEAEALWEDSRRR